MDALQLCVPRVGEGKDPGDLASSDPDALAAAIDDAMPFLGFRVNRVVSQASLRSPEDRARVATRALEVINEHPDVNVRKLYAGEVAARVGIPVADLSRQAEKRRVVETREDEIVPAVAAVPEFTAEFAAVALLLQSWDSIAPWLIEDLFANDVARRAFLALAEASESTDGTLIDNAMSLADPEVRELLERAAVADIDVEPSSVAFDLIGVAVRRALATRTRVTDAEEIRADGEARRHLEDLGSERTAQGAGTVLLGWLVERSGVSAPHD